MTARDALARPGHGWWRAGQMRGFGGARGGPGLPGAARHRVGARPVARRGGRGGVRARAGSSAWRARPSTPRRLAVPAGGVLGGPAGGARGEPGPGRCATEAGGSVRQALVRRCRFAEVPVDDLERLAVWCRTHTPEDARFIGPPGPKTFRLWSRRNLAFNRAGSPYHARAWPTGRGGSATTSASRGRTRSSSAPIFETGTAWKAATTPSRPSRRPTLAARQGAGYVLARRRRDEARATAWRPAHAPHAARAGTRFIGSNRPVQVAAEAVRTVRRFEGFGRDGVILGERADLAADALAEGGVVGGVQDRDDPGGDLPDRVLAHPAGGQGGGAHPDAAGVERLAGVVGDQVLVDRDPRPAERRLGDLAGQALRADVDEDQVVVGPARGEPEAGAGQLLGQGLGVGDDLARRTP